MRLPADRPPASARPGGRSARVRSAVITATLAVLLRRGPDYEGVPMLRRILGRSRGAIAHSHAVERELLNAGFSGPAAVIPHGAWIMDADRMAFRDRLGLDAWTPLIGIFGFLKPYKRIAESLRAFRRLIRVAPEARMLLVGEVHPEIVGTRHGQIGELDAEALAQ